MALQDKYQKYWHEINSSSLYAARMVELLACLSGLGFSLNIQPDSLDVEQHCFITEKLDFSDLYTSGFWQLTLDVWRQSAMDDDLLLLRSSRKIRDCTHDIFIRRELTQSLINQFVLYRKERLLAELGSEYLTIPINGQLAPKIVIDDSTFLPKLSLILFYETDCDNYHSELHQLIKKYFSLSKEHNQIRIITISADMNKDVNNDTASNFPWKDNVYNLKGFDDPNFRNYGIQCTPAYVLTDKEGIVRGRYTQLKEFIK